MHVVAWRFEVTTDHLEEFKKEYGPAGSWATLFQRADGYVKTDLLPSQSNPHEFTTVDYWETQKHFQDFKAAYQHEYDRLDRQLAHLTLREERLRRGPTVTRKAIWLRECRPAALILFGIASAAMGLKGFLLSSN